MSFSISYRVDDAAQVVDANSYDSLASATNELRRIAKSSILVDATVTDNNTGKVIAEWPDLKGKIYSPPSQNLKESPALDRFLQNIPGRTDRE